VPSRVDANWKGNKSQESYPQITQIDADLKTKTDEAVFWTKLFVALS